MKLEKKYWIAIICKMIVILVTFLISIFINRGLGVEQKGEYAYIINLVEMLYVILSFGIGQSYSTYKRCSNDSVKEIFVALSLIHGGVVLLIGTGIVLGLKIEYGMEIVILTALAVIKVIITMLAVIEESIKRNIVLATVNVGYFVVLAILYFTNNCYLNLVITCYAINDIVTIIVLFKSYQFRPSLRELNLEKLKSIYDTGFITMIVMLLISINYHIDTIMLKKISTSYHVGLYSVGVTFSNMFLLIPDSLKEVLFGDSTKKDFAKSVSISSIKVSLLASCIILAGFLIVGKPAISLLYGEDYSPSYNLTLILFIGSLSMIFFKILHPIYISHGSQKKAGIFLTCSAITNIIANVILIPKYNSVGAAIATAASYTVCGMFFFLDYIRDDGMDGSV